MIYMHILDKLLERDSAKNIYRQKILPYDETSTYNEQAELLEKKGWYCAKAYKHKKKMRKSKSDNTLFLDNLWCLFYNLGFDYITDSLDFILTSEDGHDDHYDIVVADRETVIFIKCLFSQTMIAGESYKEFIDEMQNIISNNHSIFLKDANNRKMKRKFVIALKNIAFTNTDMNRLKDLDIVYFDNVKINYYENLTKNLGVSAKYQFLGYLFEGQKIPNLNNQIPAIQGKMGKHIYYSFSIEPENLLKLSYVLHKDKANNNSLPSYQRLIKKNRLNEIREFVDSGGYFPNSIIININTGGHGLTFDQSSLQSNQSLSKIGILHLPRKYRCAYIIDGQHRLYGYANSIYKSKNTIPIIAFLDLDRAEQVKLFMDINEHQKAVSKGLRITLNSDLLWDSKFQRDKREAVKSVIAQNLGDDHDSPLYNRILDENDNKTTLRCITLDTIANALSACNFLSVYNKKDLLMKKGLLDFDDNTITTAQVSRLLIKCISFIKSECLQEWNKGDSNNGFLAINNGIYALIKIIDDIVVILTEQKATQIPNIDKLILQCESYLSALAKKINSLSEEEKEELKKSYGSGGKKKVWRNFEYFIRETLPEFDPPGLDEYLDNNAKKYNDESFSMIRDIECKVKADLKSKLKKKYGDDWLLHIPEKTYQDAKVLAAKKDYANREEGTDPWDCLNFINYRDIVTQSGDWSDLFEKDYSYCCNGQKGGNKKEKTNWMEKISHIRNNSYHSYSVKKVEFEYLKKIHEWFMQKDLIAG